MITPSKAPQSIQPQGRSEKIEWLIKARNPFSHLILYPANWRFFKHPRGIIPWFDHPGTAIAWADPLCDKEKSGQILGSFTKDMKAKRKSICLFLIDETTARYSMDIGYSVYKVGEMPRFDLSTWHIPRGNRGKNLRWCINHAKKSGITVIEYRPDIIRNIAHESAIRSILDAWETSQGSKAVKSIMKPAPFEGIADKRIYIAMKNNHPHAFLSCSPIYGASGFFLEDIVRIPNCVNGMGELLVVEAIEKLRSSGAHYACLGPAPLRGRSEQIDKRARWLSPIVTLAVLFMNRFYNLKQLGKYTDKFYPSSWQASYVAFKPVIPSPRLVMHIIKTMTG